MVICNIALTSQLSVWTLYKLYIGRVCVVCDTILVYAFMSSLWNGKIGSEEDFDLCALQENKCYVR